MVRLLHTRVYDLHLGALSHRPLARGGMREADVIFANQFWLVGNCLHFWKPYLVYENCSSHFRTFLND